jgi:hypothetical protein
MWLTKVLAHLVIHESQSKGRPMSAMTTLTPLRIESCQLIHVGLMFHIISEQRGCSNSNLCTTGMRYYAC